MNSNLELEPSVWCQNGSRTSGATRKALCSCTEHTPGFYTLGVFMSAFFSSLSCNQDSCLTVVSEAACSEAAKSNCLKRGLVGTSLVVQWVPAPNAGGLGSHPGLGNRSHRPQLKIQQAATKIRCSQIINKYIF